MAIKSIGIVGCGAIGNALVKAVEDGKLAVRVAVVTSRTEKSALEFLTAFKNPPPYLSLDELVRVSDLLVEAAGGHIVAELAKKARKSWCQSWELEVGVGELVSSFRWRIGLRFN